MRWHTLFAICVGALLSASVSAQAPAGRPDPSPEVLKELAESAGATDELTDTTRDITRPAEVVSLSGFTDDYQLGPGDRIQIQVVGQPDLTQNLRISATGEVSFPMLGLVSVSEQTAFEVEETLAAAFRKKGLMQHAEVLVAITEYQAKPIYIWGAVVNPGEFVMSQQLTTVDAVLLAGGLTPMAAPEGFIHRRISAAAKGLPPTAFVDAPGLERPGTEIVKVDLQALREGRFLSAALPLQSGDVLVVPSVPANMFFVVGDVLTPMNFRYPPGRVLTASQAISWAGGPLPTASMSNGMLIRYDATGQRKELAVDYAAILNGRQLDFPILPNDIIFIPGSRVKTIAHGMLLMTDTMMMQQSFRIGRRVQLPESPNQPDDR